MLYIYPYKLGSDSARQLRNGLSSLLPYRVKLVRPAGRFRPRRDDLVINWGASTKPGWKWHCDDLNQPESISVASNKLSTFQTLQNIVNIPLFTTDKEEANGWLSAGHTIVCRSLLSSHSGRGIEIVEGGGTLPNVPLYVQYKKKRSEYRVHVVKGEVIDTIQKRKRNASERPDTFNTFIRSYNNGWVFCRDNIVPDVRRDELAIQAIKTLGLDFGACDIIYNEYEDKYYLLEINTAPGLEGTTLQKYVQAFRRFA